MKNKNEIKEEIRFEKPLIISVVGKGGSGKTAITTLLAKSISTKYDFKMLLIDADPTHPHLSQMVNLIPDKSLEKLRVNVIEEILTNATDFEKAAENIDFEVYNAIAENKDFSLFSIGQPEEPGCFCPSNTLLRKVISSISKDFDIVLIDCEAGLEQINRMVIETVDILLIVSDISLRSVETAATISKSAKKFTKYKKMGVILNKAKGNIDYLVKRLGELNLPLLVKIPEDNNIAKFDRQGLPLINIPKGSSSLVAVHELLEKIFI